MKKSFLSQNKDFLEGMRDGIPIAMGYYAVAFSLGIIARKADLTPILGFIGSWFTRASAGEYGVYTQAAANAAYLEVALMCIVTNLRYLLMSTAMTQRFSPSLPLWKRLLTATCITDEIFGIAIARKGNISPAYPFGATVVAATLWAAGTACGIVMGQLLPHDVVVALSVSLYGMFLAIVIPPAKQDWIVLYAVIASFVLSGLCAITPVLSEISGGMRTILLTILISAVVAYLKPVKS